MSNAKPPPVAAKCRSTDVDVLECVIGIAPSPLLPGETEADYLGVAQRIVAFVQPKDAIEEFLTRDVVDLTWDIFRLRRMKAGLLRASTSGGVTRILSTTGNGAIFPLTPEGPLCSGVGQRECKCTRRICRKS